MKTVGAPLTEIVSYPIPKIPSNLAATNAKPGSLTASPNICDLTFSPLI